MRVYLAGPMSGIDQHNFPAFHGAADLLRDLGLDVASPAELDGDPPDRQPTEREWQAYLRRDLPVMLDCDAVVVLPGWEDSRGARLEVRTALAVGIPVHRYDFMDVVQTDWGPTLSHGQIRDVPFDPNETIQLLMAADDHDDPPAARRALDRRQGCEQGEERVTNQVTGGQKGRKLARMDLLPWDCLWQVAEVYGDGALKYEERNWERGYDWSLSIGAAGRHLGQFAAGENNDADSGLPHPAHATFHCLALLRFLREFPNLDDRPAITNLPWG